ncbi:MAG: DOMON-like domain-containing protein [Povalibacter sp.]
MNPAYSFVLFAHPTTPCPFIAAFEARVEHATAGGFSFTYLLRGDLLQLDVPVITAAERTDGLWRQTCFEAFLRPTGTSAYREFNFSPSTQWAAYSFAGYRDAMMPLRLSSAPAITCEITAEELSLRATLTNLEGTSRAFQLGLSAVLRDRGGKIYYWALQHAPGKPDFHHDASFAASLDGAT